MQIDESKVVWDKPPAIDESKVVWDKPAYSPSVLDPKTNGLDATASAYRPQNLRESGYAPSPAEEFLGGAKHAWDRAAMGVKGVFADLTPEDKALLEQGGAFTKQTSPFSSIGQAGGDVAITAPIIAAGGGVPVLARTINAMRGIPYAGRTLVAGADVAGNAALSGVLAPPGERGEAAAYGGAGAFGGRVLHRALGQGARPVMSEDARALSQAGVTLTPGQAIPGLGGIEQRMTSIPIAGDIIQRGRQRAVADYGRVEIDKALENLPGAKLIPRNKVGAEAVDEAQRQISAAYDSALKDMVVRPLDVNSSVVLTRKALDDIPLLDDAQKAKVLKYMELRVLPQAKMGGITGQEAKALDSEMGHYARQYSRSPNPADHPLGDAFYGLQQRWRVAMTHGSTSEKRALLEGANEAYKNLLPIVKVSERTHEGTYTPRLLRQSVMRQHQTPTDLNVAGINTLSSTVPDSGTAGRVAQAALTAGAALGTGTLPHLAAGAAGAAVGYSRLALDALAGNTKLQRWVMSQPDAGVALEQLGRAIAAQQAEQ